MIWKCVVIAFCLLGSSSTFGGLGADSPGPAKFVVEPEIVITNMTSKRSLVHATVIDSHGFTISNVRVDFISNSPGLIEFPYPRAVTDRDGTAANIVLRVPDDPRGLVATFVVSTGSIESAPISVMGDNTVHDGPFGFRAPPLGPFAGPMQVLSGEYSGFPYPEGFQPRAWSIDPSIVEAQPGRVGFNTSTRQQTLEFAITAYQIGETAFIIETSDLALYKVKVFGNLNPVFLRGDSDGNGRMELTDAILLLNHLFLARLIRCLEAADVDDSGTLNITDPIYLLTYLFLGGTAPPAPFPASGTDTTPDLLGCEEPP